MNTTQHFHCTEEGNKIAYYIVGNQCQIIVFLHGMTSSAISWSLIIDHLKNKFTCISIDLPGNGLSDDMPGKWTLKLIAKQIIGLIQVLGFKKINLVGHSLGAQIGLRMMLNNKDLVDKAILFAPAGLEKYNFWQQQTIKNGAAMFPMITDDWQYIGQTIYSSIYKQRPNTNQLIEALRLRLNQAKPGAYLRMINKYINAMVDEPVIDELINLNLPIKIVFGEKDPLIPNVLFHSISTTKFAENAIRNFKVGSLSILPQTGHFIPWEQPEQCTEIIVKFLMGE